MVLHPFSPEHIINVAQVWPTARESAAMARIDLTDRKVAGLRPKSNRYELTDRLAPGLGIRVSPSGTRIWFYKGRFPPSTHPVRRTINEYPLLSLEQARAVAREWRLQIKAGVDPQRREAEQRAAAAAAEERKREGSFRQVAEAFIKRHVSKLARARGVELIVQNELLARWHDRQIDEISRRDIIQMVEEIADRAPGMASVVFATCRSLFNFAVDRDLLVASPCDRVKPAKLIGSRSQRSRVLSDAEIKSLWEACDTLGFPYGQIYRLLLLSGCRKMEVGEARWSEFDLPGKLWTIGPDRTKTDTAHVVPLSGMALEVLASLPRIGDSNLLFTLSGRPLNDYDKQKARLDKLMGNPEPPFVVHDLRRTVRTRLSELGVPQHVAELCLGHTQKGLHAVYDLHTFAHEKRQALDAWAAALHKIIT